MGRWPADRGFAQGLMSWAVVSGNVCGFFGGGVRFLGVGGRVMIFFLGHCVFRL